MKYVILIWSNPRSRQIWTELSDADRGAGLHAYAALTAELTGSGELLAAEALASPELASRIPARDPAMDLSTDVPLAEAKEHLAGFYLVDCPDAARAAQIAGRIPEAAFGLVQVWPVMTYSMPEL
jgi:hypothetical protein